MSQDKDSRYSDKPAGPAFDESFGEGVAWRRDSACPFVADLLALARAEVRHQAAPENADEMKQHVQRCGDCRTLFDSQKRAMRELDRTKGPAAEKSLLDDFQLAMGRRPALRAGGWSITSYVSRPFVLFGKRLRELQPQYLAASVIICLMCALGAGAATAIAIRSWIPTDAVVDRIWLTRAVRWATDDEEDPPASLLDARPLVVDDRGEVILKGEAAANWIRRIYFIVMEGDKEVWRKTIEIGPNVTPDETTVKVVKFAESYRPPMDGRLRVAMVRLEKQPNLPKTAQKFLEPSEVSIHLACQDPAPALLSGMLDQDPVITVERTNSRIHVTSRARSHANSYLTIGTQSPGMHGWQPHTIKEVTKYGQEFDFDVSLPRDGKELTIRAFTVSKDKTTEMEFAEGLRDDRCGEFLMSDKQVVPAEPRIPSSKKIDDPHTSDEVPSLANPSASPTGAPPMDAPSPELTPNIAPESAPHKPNDAAAVMRVDDGDRPKPCFAEDNPAICESHEYAVTVDVPHGALPFVVILAPEKAPDRGYVQATRFLGIDEVTRTVYLGMPAPTAEAYDLLLVTYPRGVRVPKEGEIDLADLEKLGFAEVADSISVKRTR